jgi:hypothetical protein
MPQLLYPLDRRLSQPQSQLGHCRVEKSLLLLLGIELQSTAHHCTDKAVLASHYGGPDLSPSQGFVVDKTALGQVCSEPVSFLLHFHWLLQTHQLASGAGAIGHSCLMGQVDSVSRHPKKLKYWLSCLAPISLITPKMREPAYSPNVMTKYACYYSGFGTPIPLRYETACTQRDMLLLCEWNN